VRTAEANPLVIELLFPRPRQVRGLDLIIGSADVEITVESSVAGSSERRFTIQQKGLLDQPQVHLDFGELVAVQQMRIKLLDRSTQDPAHVHLWEIYFKDN
jgi:hypothetical protein